MILSPASIRIIRENNAKCAGTVAGAEITAMMARSHPVLAILDGLLRMAEYNVRELETRICDDGYTGPLWLRMARDVRYMFSSASPKGFDAGTCEAIFWHAMEVAGFNEGDL